MPSYSLSSNNMMSLKYSLVLVAIIDLKINSAAMSIKFDCLIR